MHSSGSAFLCRKSRLVASSKPDVNCPWPDERLLRNHVLAVRASCRLGQDELDWPALAGDFRDNPIKRNLGIIRMTMLAGLDLLFRLLRCCRINRHQLNTRTHLAIHRHRIRSATSIRPPVHRNEAGTSFLLCSAL
jgi:hypothetical protein